MNQPSISRSERSAVGAGLHERVRHAANRAARRGQTPALLQAPSLRASELDSLRAWLTGSSALRPEVARLLLERAIERRQLVREPALHWRAVKARIAGDTNWAPMGFKLILD